MFKDHYIKFTTYPNYKNARSLGKIKESIKQFEKRFIKPKFGSKLDAESFTFATFGNIENKKGNYRHAGNVKEYYGIVLDFDNKFTDYLSFEDAIELLKEYYFIAYTTHSHRPELNKFRIIIPTKIPFESKYLKSVDEYFRVLMKPGDSLDNASCTVSQAFVLPVCENKRQEYLYHINDSIKELFDPSELIKNFPKEQNKLIKEKKKSIRKDIQNELPVENIDDYPISSKIKKLIKSGDASKFENDRSRLLFHIITHLVEIGLQDMAIASILFNTEFGVSERSIEKGKEWTFDEIARIRGKSRTPKLILGIDEYFKNDATKTMEATKAQSILNSLVKWWIKELPGNRAIAAAAGLGKTHAILENIILNSENRFYEIYVPDHNLAEQLKERFSKLVDKLKYDGLIKIDYSIEVNVIRGRNHKRNDEDKPLCAMSKEANIIANHGISVYANLCNKNCEFKNNCPYLAQFKEDAQVRIFPHARLPLARGFLDSRIPDAAIIDESFYEAMIRSNDGNEFSLENIDYFIANKELSALIIEYLSKRQPLLLGLRNKYKDKVIEVLLDAANKVYPKIDLKGLDKNQLIQELESYYNTREKKILAAMFNLLADEIQAFPKREYSIVVRYVEDRYGSSVVLAIRHEMTRFTKKSYIASGIQSVPVLCIDADYRQKIGKIFFPSIKFKNICVERNAHITQINSAINSRQRFSIRAKATENEIENVKKHIDKMVNIIQGISAKHGKTLIVAYKFLLEKDKKNDIQGIKQRLAASPNYEFSHFGGLRGSNDFEDCDAVVIIGRQQIGSIAIEKEAASLFWDSKKELKLTGRLEQKARGYRLRSGKKIGVKVDVCADKRSQMLLELQRECETLQALDRIRLIHNKKPKHVYLLCNLPLDIDVDNLISLTDLKSNKTPSQELFEKAFSLAPNNVLPINTSKLVADYPNIFSSNKKANEALNEAGFSGSWHTLNFLTIAINNSQWNLIEFNAKRKSKKPFKALVPIKMSYDNVVSNLERIFQVEITIKNSLIKQHDIQFSKPIPSELDLLSDVYYCSPESKLRYDPYLKAWCLDYD